MRTALLILGGLAVSASVAWRSSRKQEPALFRRTQDRLTLAAVPNAADIDVPIT
jgi:hypothetical protein